MKRPSAKAARESAIRNFVFDKNRKRLEWELAGVRVAPAAPNFEQALVDPEHDLVFALDTTPQGRAGRLHVFDARGNEQVVLDPPEGFGFYYLTPYSGYGLAVVTSAHQPVEGRRDWHFSLDLKTMKLFRHAPAY